MSSTKFISGLGDSNKPSSKVLRPPGGGNSQLFGDDVPHTPRSVKNHMASNIFGSDQNASVKQTGDRRGQKQTDSYTRLFGEPERNYTPAKNHMKSSIPIGGANGSTSSASSSSTSNGMETNGHKNGNGTHHHQNGNGTALSSSASSSARNGKMENGGGSSSCASSEYQNGVSKTEIENKKNYSEIKEISENEVTNQSSSNSNSINLECDDNKISLISSDPIIDSIDIDQIKLDLYDSENDEKIENIISPPEIDISRPNLSINRTASARTKFENEKNYHQTTLSPKQQQKKQQQEHQQQKNMKLQEKGGNDLSIQSFSQPADSDVHQQYNGDDDKLNIIKEDDTISIISNRPLSKKEISQQQQQQTQPEVNNTELQLNSIRNIDVDSLNRSQSATTTPSSATTTTKTTTSSYGLINMANANVKSPRRDIKICRNPVTGTGLGDLTDIRFRRCANQHKDGNPVTGEGYKGAEINTSIPSLNGANQVINKNRIPPGGYSSGLW